MGVGVGSGNDTKGRESQIKMILPPEPGPVKGGKKGEKKKNQRVYLQASKFVFTDKRKSRPYVLLRYKADVKSMNSSKMQGRHSRS